MDAQITGELIVTLGALVTAIVTTLGKADKRYVGSLAEQVKELKIAVAQCHTDRTADREEFAQEREKLLTDARRLNERLMDLLSRSPQSPR